MKVLLAIAIPVLLLQAVSLVVFVNRRTVCAALQLLGAGCFTLMLLTHVFEQSHIFPEMGWGLPASAGHYLDLSSAVGGLTLFPAGYLLEALATRSRRQQLE